jgi:AAA15 family ATPase/GTPase
MYGQSDQTPLTPFTVVIGKNGAGKSTLFDAFGFIALLDAKCGGGV